MAENKDTTKILVVDDEPHAVQEICEYLEDANYSCIKASDAQAAIHLIEADNQIRLMLLDVKMPQMDGLELMDKIQQRIGPRLGVILFSGHSGEDEIIKGMRGKALDFLRKPINPTELLESIKKATEAMNKVYSKRVSSAYSEATGLAKEFLQKLEELVEEKALTEKDKAQKVRSTQRVLDLIKRSYQHQQTFKSLRLKIDPALLMLFELYHPSNSRGIAVTALCHSGKTAQTTALRRIQDLEMAGYIKRKGDSKDKRRAVLTLTQRGIDALDGYARVVFNPAA